MAGKDVSEQAAELMAMFYGMNRADREALVRFAQARKAKYPDKSRGTSYAPPVGILTMAAMRNSRGAFFDGVRGEI